MTTRRTLASAVAGAATITTLAAVLAGPAAGAGTAADACKPPAQFPGARGVIYRDYCGICRDTGWKEIKRTYQLKGATARVVAHSYAAYDHFGSVLPPASRGCYRGFVLRGKP